MAKWVIGLSIALFFLAAIGVAAVTQIETADTSGWGPNTVILWGLIGVSVVIAFVVKILHSAGLFGGGDLD
jgi:hypothetical protein